MSFSASALQRTAWLFTRGEDSITMMVREDDAGLTLIVRGPDSGGAIYHFTDIAGLMTFAKAHEQKLLEAGFRLQASVERRGGADRRRQRRPGAPERRRSPIQ